MEVIERRAGPEPPPALEGGPCGKGWESHRGAVILVLGLLLFCMLEGHRVGAGPDSLASAPGYSGRQGSSLESTIGILPNPRGQVSSKLLHLLLALRTQPLMLQPCAQPFIPPPRP